MTQIKFNQEKDIQLKMIQILEQNNIHAIALFAFAKTDNGIEPMIIVSNDTPEQDAVIDNLYALFDHYFNFREIWETSKEKK